ncbi:membrane protein, partial [mine drainage metagenome]
ARATLIPPYVNHAHNDYLELWLEGGMPALLLMLAFVGGWAWRSLRAWRAPIADDPSDGAATLSALIARAAAVGVLVLLLHATVDYALRTLALEATLAVLCAWLARGAAQRRRRDPTPRALRADSGLVTQSSSPQVPMDYQLRCCKALPAFAGMTNS